MFILHVHFCSWQGPQDSEESESNTTTEQAVARSSEVGRVMTEEEYEDWKKEKEGGTQSEEDTGINWGMGKIQLCSVSEKSREVTFSAVICFERNCCTVGQEKHLHVVEYQLEGKGN